MLRIACLAVALSAGLFGQSSPEFPQELKNFLSLTDSQADAVGKAVAAYDGLVNQKSQRLNQIQVEVAAELRKDPLDPMAIGLYYAEAESIARGMRSELNAMRVKVTGLLTEPQKTKLKSLEDAMKLSVTVSQAQCLGFLTPEQPPGADSPFYAPNLYRSTITATWGSWSGGGCGWFDTSGFRFAIGGNATQRSQPARK
jgi:hypothetical protein